MGQKKQKTLLGFKGIKKLTGRLGYHAMLRSRIRSQNQISFFELEPLRRRVLRKMFGLFKQAHSAIFENKIENNLVRAIDKKLHKTSYAKNNA